MISKKSKPLLSRRSR